MAERILIIDGHPDPHPDRYCHALTSAYALGAARSDRQVRILRVGELAFGHIRTASHFSMPTEHDDIKSAQADVAWCDHIVMIYPLWLGTMPALLRTFLEQISCGGFATHSDGHRWARKLRGKTARLLVTMSMSTTDYRWTIASPVLHFLGVAPVRVTLFGGIEGPRARLQQRLDFVRRLGERGK